MAAPSSSSSSHYFYTNYQLSNSAIQLRSKIEPHVRPQRQPIPRSYTSVTSEAQEAMARGLQPRYPSMATTWADSSPGQRRTGKKLFDGTPPSVEYKLKKRERLLVSNAQTVGAEQRWPWDQVRAAPVPVSAGARPVASRLAPAHPNSMETIVSSWRRTLSDSRAQTPVHYHRKNLFSRQTFIDGTAEIGAIVHDYPYDGSGLQAAPVYDHDHYRPG